MFAEKDITDALGGPKLLGRKAESLFDFADMIQRGLPSKAAFFLQKELGLGDREYSSILGVSVKSLGRFRRTPREHLDVHLSDRLYRIARIFALALKVLESKEGAIGWLHRPQTGLKERTPLELMSTDAGAKQVEELLYRIEYGIYS